MKAFNTMARSLFSDKNLTTTATYVQRGGNHLQIQIIAHKPDAFQVIGESVIAMPTLTIDVMLSSVPNIVPGERFVIDSQTYVVQGEPKRDSENITVRIGLCAA